MAHASIISYSLTQSGCSVGCSVLPAGTITVEQFAPGDILVSVQLGSDYSFRKANDSNHYGLVFNLLNNPTVVISGIVSGDTTSQTWALAQTGTFNASPFGAFEYALSCTTCTSGMAGVTTRSLSFHLQASGLTEAGFTATNNIYFAVDVMGKTASAGIGNTGNIGALQGTPIVPQLQSAVPETGSLTMLASGMGCLLFSAGLRRLRAARVTTS